MLTQFQGGTSGIGAVVAKDLALRGAQIILLTHAPLTDPFLADYIIDLRTVTNNELITAEHVDLSSLHSIRLFATKWIDNAPPRRLDMIVLCANTQTPPGGVLTMTEDGMESSWGINYMANFHLLSILSPAIRAQPPDRDVRILVGMCTSYMGGSLDELSEEALGNATSSKTGKKVTKTTKKALPSEAVTYRSATAFSNSKLALFTFVNAFQKHLSSYQRPDKQPNNARVFTVDPGWTRTPGMLRYLTAGSLWGLGLYLIMWPFWWLVLKSPYQGAQSFLFAAMEGELIKSEGGMLIKECRPRPILKPEVNDEKFQKVLWEESDKMITLFETESAMKRAEEKKMQEKQNDKAADDSKSQQAKAPGSRRSRKAA
jgi:NAD(P)-dependent dehydrogenase (short-subunit alcohol dehydrogenase family)